jgi:hypothetical protein
MVDLDSAIYTYLTSLTGLTALIGDRLWPMTRDVSVETLPAVVFQRISNVRRYTLTGSALLHTARYQFSSLASAHVTVGGVVGASNVAAQVVKAFDGYAGLMGTVSVGSAFVVGERDEHDPELGVYRADVDALITYTETA